MKALVLFCCTILGTTSLFSQNIYPEKYDDCNSGLFLLEGKKILIDIDNEQLLSNILEQLDPKILNKLMGDLYFQVYVDSLGNHCCLSLKNELNKKGQNVNFKKIVDENTVWSIPTRENNIAAVSAMVKIQFTKETIFLSRLGFNGKVGWLELSRVEYDRTSAKTK